MANTGFLILENGKIFKGTSFGSTKPVSGEVVFNTGMVGYPEGFTDPSYYGQILTMTYPLIGNYGVPPNKFFESEKTQIRGLIVSSNYDDTNHWQAKGNLSSWLKKEGVPALSGIDTRTLTQILREFGTMCGQITFSIPSSGGIVFEDINSVNLVKFVSSKKVQVYKGGRFRLLVIDCGLKENQIRIFQKLGLTVIKIPWDYNPFIPQKKLDFDAVFISNGPGDPKMVTATIATVAEVLKRKIPTLGICLGNQILALSAGANTYKLKYGHRGQNQPVVDEQTKHCFVTTQNHGFAVDVQTLPYGWIPWFTNLNDGTNEGIKHSKLPFFSTQFHPEACPGPTDTEWVLNFFINEAKKWLKKN